ncbi:hypothetical protein G6F32_017018 [Rhizopus arrhizus]|nr:hypothetical protein G6F32_017018 [Rhizopus arrhizus]
MFARPDSGASPAVAVACRPALPEFNGVQHRRLGPPRQHVIALEASAQRIGAVAHQHPVQLGRQRALHGQVHQVDFIGQRRGGASVQIE